ncbi:hypothetical protein [Glycomyces xiaoerkulensis]|uniref:hypothetical protein n=1 Tax=Glycomyces xiaoerkulensis TaxID=2038139 RepID=UPI000C260506|nr:hypothetical protein [Glycomyces xiaoerkulensis]
MPLYDLDKIEEVGTKHAPALADWYFDTLEAIDKVGRWREDAFSAYLDPLWHDCFVFTYEVVTKARSTSLSTSGLRSKRLGIGACSSKRRRLHADTG